MKTKQNHALCGLNRSGDKPSHANHVPLDERVADLPNLYCNDSRASQCPSCIVMRGKGYCTYRSEGDYIKRGVRSAIELRASEGLGRSYEFRPESTKLSSFGDYREMAYEVTRETLSTLFS